MNAQRLLAYYDQISDVPDAVERLRRLILDLAVRGKLVPQEGRDGPAADQLTAARSALAKRAETISRQRWSPSPPVRHDEIPAEIPPGWVAARVNDTGLYVNGLAFKPSDWTRNGLPIVRIQNLTDPSKQFNYASGQFPDEVIVRDGDILVSWSATLDVFEWARGVAVLNQHIFRVLSAAELTDKRFLYLLLRAAIRAMAEGTHAHGLVMTHINRGPFLSHLVLIPPLAEQHRIVAKVDELMEICDRLDTTRTKREAARDRFAAATLTRLTDPVQNTLVSDAHLAVERIDTLTARPDQIRPLRETFIALAVRGQLVRQMGQEDDVAAQLAAVDSIRNDVAEKDHRADRVELPVLLAEYRWSVPPTWRWRALADLALFVDYRGKTPVKTNQGTRLITAKNVRRSKINLAPEEWISDIEYRRWMTRGFPERGNILFTTEAPMGNAAVVTLDEPFALAQRVICFQLYGALEPEFLELQLLSSPWQRILEQASTGLTAKGIKGAKLKRLPIAIPPLAEQRRIVAKVNELITVCDQLETTLNSASSIRVRLFDSVIADALTTIASRDEVAL